MSTSTRSRHACCPGALFSSLKSALPEPQKLLDESSGAWGYEDPRWRSPTDDSDRTATHAPERLGGAALPLPPPLSRAPSPPATSRIAGIPPRNPADRRCDRGTRREKLRVRHGPLALKLCSSPAHRAELRAFRPSRRASSASCGVSRHSHHETATFRASSLLGQRVRLSSR